MSCMKRLLHRWRRHLVKAGLLAFMLTTLSEAVWAANCQSVGSGNWGNGSSWAGAGCVGTVPRSTDTVTIQAGHTITLNVSSTVVGVTIAAGGSLQADSNNRVLTITPGASGTAFSVSVATAFVPNNSTVVIGTSATPVAINVGTVTFNNLVINSTVTANSVYTLGSASVTCLGTFTFNPLKATAGSVSVQLSMGAPMTVGSTATIMATTNAVATFTSTTNNYAFTAGHLNIGANGAFLANGSLITLKATNTVFTRTGTFTAGTSTVSFTGLTTTLSGATTFYGMRAVTANTTIYFSAGTTQYVTRTADFQNVTLRSNIDNSPWYFNYTGLNQTLIGTQVKDSNAAAGSILICDTTSTDLGNNLNWAFGDVRYWAASGPSNWNNTASWSRASGGSTGASIPTSTHTVIFDGANNKNGQANIDVTVNVASLTISGYTGTFNTQGFAVTVTSAVTQTSGVFTLTNNTLSIGGDFLRTGGTFNSAASTITLTGTQNQIFDAGGATLFNVYLNKTVGIVTLGDVLISTGNLTIAGGTLDTSATGNWAVIVTSHVRLTGGAFNLNASTMSVGRDWLRTSCAFDAGVSTISFLGGNTQTITSGGTNFSHLIVNKSPGTALNISGPLNVNGNWTHTNGTLNTQNYALAIGSDTVLTSGLWNLGTSSVSIAGNFTRIGSTFTTSASTIIFNGAFDQSLNAGNTSFFNIQINKTGGIATLSSQLIATGNLTVTAGTLNTGNNWAVTVTSHVVLNGGTLTLNASTMSVQRDWLTSNGSILNAMTSTVTFTGVNNQNILSNGSSFRNVTINKSAGSALLTDDIDVDGIFTNTLGTFNTGGNAVTVGNDWRWTAGTYTGTNSTVTFNSPTSTRLVGSTTFYALRDITPNTTLYFTAGSTQYVSAIIDLEGVYLRSTTNNATWYLRYNGTNQTLSDVTVQDSNANLANTLYADSLSFNAGNNRNWDFSDARYWIASGPGNWSDTANWSYSNAGSGGSSVPSAGDTVIFDGANGHNGDCTVDVTVNVATVSISGYTGTLNTNGFAVMVSSALSQTSGALALGVSHLTLGGNFTRSGGSFNEGTSTVSFTGAQNQTLTPAGAALYHVDINKTAGTLTLSGNLSVQGNWINTAGNFVHGNSTISFTATQTRQLKSNGQPFYRLAFTGAGSWNLGDALTVAGQLSLTNGNLNSSPNWSITASSDVIFNGGTLTLNTSTMSVAGHWNYGSGSFSAGTSTVTFNGTGTQNLISNGTSFNNIAVSKTAGSVVLQNALDVNNNFTLTSSTLNANGKAISVAGNWNVSASTFAANGATVTFDGATAQTLSGSTTFYALRAVIPTLTLSFTANTTQYVTSLIDFENVNLRSTVNGTDWNFKYSGSSQTILGVDVADSNAYLGSTLIADSQSTDSGNNSNWAFGDVRYWAASGASNWNNTASWSRASGGSTGASVPTSTHTVVFDGVNNKNGQANIDVTVNVASLTISGYTGTFNTQGFAVTVTSAVTQTSGVFTLTNNTLSIGGDFLRTGGTFNSAASTITLTGTQNQIFDAGGATLFNVYLNKTVGIVTLGDVLISTGNLTIAGGTLDTSATGNWAVIVTSHVRLTGGAFNLNASTMSVGRDWLRTSCAFDAGVSTISFLGGNTQTITSGGTNFSHLIVNKSPGTALNISGPLNVNGNWTHTNGTLNTQNYALAIGSDTVLTSGLWNLGTSSVSIAGNFTRIGSTFTTSASTIIFNGAFDQSLNAGNTSFFNIQINKTGGIATLSSQLIATGNLTVTAGTLNTGNNWAVTVTSHVVLNGGTLTLNASTMSVQRDWLTSNGSILNAMTSTVTFTGVNNQNILSNGSSFRNVTINKSAGSALLTDDIDVDGIFTNTLGTFNTGGNAVTVGNDWRWTAGTYTGTNSTVTFNSPTSTRLVGSTTFYALRDITPNTTLYFTAGSTQYVSTIIDLEGVYLRSTTSNATWYLRYNGTNQILSDVTVQDSNANLANTLYADSLSFNAGNNRNWDFSDARYWIASGPGNWSDTANWSYSNAGPGGSSVPSAGDTVIFDGANGHNGDCTVDVTVNVATVSISGYTGTLNTNGFAVMVSSALSQTSGALALGVSHLTLGGNFTRSGGSFNEGTSTVSFTGAQNQTLTPAGAALYHVDINKTAGTLTLSGNLSVQGNWINTAGNFAHGNSTITFTAAQTRQLESNGQPFYRLAFTGAGTWNLGDALTIAGQLSLTNGNLNSSPNWSITASSDVVFNGGMLTLNASTMSVAGQWIYGTGSFSAGTSTVTFNGTATQNIASNGISFGNLSVNKTAGSVVLQSALDVNSNFTLTTSTFNSNGKAVAIGGNWNIGTSTFASNGSTVTFDGTTSGLTLSGTMTGANDFDFLTFNGAGGDWTLLSPVLVTSTLTVTAGTLRGTQNVTVNGGVVGNGTTGAIALTGGTFEQRVASDNYFGTNVAGANDWSFNNLTFSNSSASNRTIRTSANGSGNILVNGDLTVAYSTDSKITTLDSNSFDRALVINGDILITNRGALQASSSLPLVAAGDWTNAGTFTANGSTVTFAAAITQKVNHRGGTFATVISSNTGFGGAVFSSSFTAQRFFVNTADLSSAATVYFAGNVTFVISTVSVSGTSTYPVVIRSTDSGNAWILNNTSTNSVSYVYTENSNASPGKLIVDSPGGVDLHGNQNWLFAAVAPTGLTASTAQTTSLSWGWTATTPAANSYTLQVSSNSDFSAPLTSSTTALTISTTSSLSANTTYYARVNSTIATLTSEWSAAVATATLANPPITAASTWTAVQLTSITVTWQANGNPTGRTQFMLDISTVSGFTSGTPISSVTYNTSAIFTGLDVGVTYYARVKATNHSGVDTAYTALGSTVTRTIPPPTNLIFSDASTTSLDLMWTASSLTPDSYTLAISTNNDFSASSTTVSTALLSATTSNLLINVTYYARVNAVIYGYASAWTAVATTATFANAPATAASTWSAVNFTSVTVTWSNNSNSTLTSYVTQLSTVSDFGSGNVLSSTTRVVSAEFTGLVPATTYYTRVKAVNNSGISTAWANLGSTITLTPNAPTSLHFTAAQTNSLTAAWSASNPPANSYTLQVSTDENFRGTLIGSTTANLFAISPATLTPNTTYFGRVNTIINGSSSPWSNSDSTATFANAPATVSSTWTNVGFYSLTVNWLNNNNPLDTDYIVELSTDPGFADIVTLSASTTSLSMDFSDLDAATTYYSHVKALNYQGVSSTFTSLGSTVTITPVTCNAKATGNWSNAATWTNCTGPGGLPDATDIISINSGVTVTLDQDATVGGMIFAAASPANGLTHSGTYALTVNGSVTMNQPSNNSVTSFWDINAGSATVSGLISVKGSSPQASRVSRITITTGELNAFGGMTFVASNILGKQLIMSGGAGRLNLKGVLTVPASAVTFTPGSAGSAVNFMDDSAAQTIAFFPSAYYNLYLNNTSANGVTLNTAISATNVTGDLRVQSGTFNNGGNAIAGAAGKMFEVAAGANFAMTGTSAFPSFSTYSFASTSRVRYLQTTPTLSISTQTFGHLDLMPAANATQNFLAGTLNVQGDLSIGNGTNATTASANANNTTLTVGGSVTINSNASFIANATNPLNVGGNWTNAGTFTNSNSTVVFNGTTTQTFAGSSTFYGLRAITAGATLQFTAGTTQSITNAVILSNISLLSTTNNQSWYFAYSGSTAAITNVTVQDSDASNGARLQASGNNIDLGGNINWDFGPPSAISDLNATPSVFGGVLDVTWSAPGENGSIGTLFTSSFTVQYTTDAVFAAGNSWSPTAALPTNVYRVDIATTNVAPGSIQRTALSNLIDGATYYLRAWTQDAHTNYSSISNGATNYATNIVLAVDLSTDSLNFGNLPAGTTSIYTSSITITNRGNVVSKFNIALTNPAVWKATTSAAGVDSFRLTGVFKDTLPVTADFNSSNDVITTSTVTASSTVFANDADADSMKGIAVGPNQSRIFWTQIEVPVMVTTLDEQVIHLNASTSQ